MEPRDEPDPASADADFFGDTHPGITFDPELRAFLAMSREASAISPEASGPRRDDPKDAVYPDEYRPDRAADYRSSPHAIGAGFLILVARELIGTTQRGLAHRVGTSQPTLARIETGNRIPTVRTLMKFAPAAGFELVLGLRRPDARLPPKRTLDAFALLSTLHLNDDDGLADFVIYREPTPLEGPRDD